MAFSSLGPETLKHLQYVGQFHTVGIIPSKMPTCLPWEHSRALRMPRLGKDGRKGKLRPGYREHTGFPMEEGFISCKPTE